jgi:hypothetical protein
MWRTTNEVLQVFPLDPSACRGEWVPGAVVSVCAESGGRVDREREEDPTSINPFIDHIFQGVVNVEEIKSTTAGQLTRLEIGKSVGVVTESGAYVRDTLLGVIYGAEANRQEIDVSATTGDGPTVLLAFTNSVPADQRWDSHVGRYFRVPSNAIATVYRDESVSAPSDSGRADG